MILNLTEAIQLISFLIITISTSSCHMVLGDGGDDEGASSLPSSPPTTTTTTTTPTATATTATSSNSFLSQATSNSQTTLSASNAAPPNQLLDAYQPYKEFDAAAFSIKSDVNVQFKRQVLNALGIDEEPKRREMPDTTLSGADLYIQSLYKNLGVKLKGRFSVSPSDAHLKLLTQQDSSDGNGPKKLVISNFGEMLSSDVQRAINESDTIVSCSNQNFTSSSDLEFELSPSILRLLGPKTPILAAQLRIFRNWTESSNYNHPNRNPHQPNKGSFKVTSRLIEDSEHSKPTEPKHDYIEISAAKETLNIDAEEVSKIIPNDFTGWINIDLTKVVRRWARPFGKLGGSGQSKLGLKLVVDDDDNKQISGYGLLNAASVSKELHPFIVIYLLTKDVPSRPFNLQELAVSQTEFTTKQDSITPTPTITTNTSSTSLSEITDSDLRSHAQFDANSNQHQYLLPMSQLRPDNKSRTLDYESHFRSNLKITESIRADNKERKKRSSSHQHQISNPTLHTHNRDNTNANEKSSLYRDKPTRLPVRNIFHQKFCNKNSMFVHFGELKWNDWIIAPDGFEAWHCGGKCPFPLPPNINSSNHAIVQMLAHLMNPSVPEPCCSPKGFQPISVLYYDDYSNVVLKEYRNMIVQSCGCS